jgi:hypothetical protein
MFKRLVHLSTTICRTRHFITIGLSENCAVSDLHCLIDTVEANNMIYRLELVGAQVETEVQLAW